MNHKYSFHSVWSDEDEAFIVCVPELPGCKADGTTIAEALATLDLVIEHWIATAKEQGRPVPTPLTVADYEASAKKFREELAEHVKREVETAVQRVIKDISRYNPVLAGAKDPADYWKGC